MLAINAGSGQRRFEGHGWVNVDCVSRPPDQVPDVICNIAKERWPFEDGTADLVVLSQVIEHFHLTEGDPVITESHRVLRVGGSLIMTFPNMRTLARAWLRGDISDYIFGVNTYGAWQGEEGDDHHWHWSSASLAEYISKLAQWSQVKTFDFRQIPGASIAQDWWVESVEAIK